LPTEKTIVGGLELGGGVAPAEPVLPAVPVRAAGCAVGLVVYGSLRRCLPPVPAVAAVLLPPAATTDANVAGGVLFEVVVRIL
jgi:hypothetical protein